MSSKKPRSNGKNNGKGNHYFHQGTENNGSVGKASRDKLNEFQIAKLREDIFASPEFEQDIKESDFRDFPDKSSKLGDYREGIKDRKVASKPMERIIQMWLQDGTIWDWYIRILESIRKQLSIMKRL